VDERIAWVPGVTIDEAVKLRDEGACWVAEWRTEPDAALSRRTNRPGEMRGREDGTT
jgi:hypothetical protein